MLSDKQQQDIISQWSELVPITTIAKNIGSTRKAVAKFAKERELPKRPQITNLTKDECVSLHKKIKTGGANACFLAGHCYHHLKVVSKAYGLDIDFIKQPPIKESTISEMLRYKKSGYPIRYIAKKFSVSPRSVHLHTKSVKAFPIKQMKIRHEQLKQLYPTQQAQIAAGIETIQFRDFFFMTKLD